MEEFFLRCKNEDGLFLLDSITSNSSSHFRFEIIAR